MFGRRSLNPRLLPLDPNLARTIRRSRSAKSIVHNPPQRDPLSHSSLFIEPQNMADNAPHGGRIDLNDPNNNNNNRNNNNNNRNNENDEEVVDVNTQTLRDRFAPRTQAQPSCIRIPPATGNGSYEIKTSTLNHLPKFSGEGQNDPYEHLELFVRLCSTFRVSNLTEEGVYLRLFPFTLEREASRWLYSLDADSITTWNELQATFLEKYFPHSRTNHVRWQIMNISQLTGEEFHSYWGRLKEYTRSCPHHGLSKLELIQNFYAGLHPHQRQLVDVASGGVFMRKTADELWTLMERAKREFAKQCFI